MTAEPVCADEAFVRQLAAAFVEKPRANLQELANAVGVSKATLYRFCRTREQLQERLEEASTRAVDRVICGANLESAPIRTALRNLIDNHLHHREFTSFLIHYWEPDLENEAAPVQVWNAAMDAFFLRGQKEGVFRIDLPAPALTELLVTIILGMIDAERRGRVARGNLGDVIESAFLQGSAAI
ncbi:transcriptional regulator [Spongiibacter taiwanensis]|uniref:TetR/AcrR family transcriptional regulator n=1 Tax=Spongiibacter taiwanensis TaxID=1748242 RepID=UPI002034E60D|nr:transcriptional regulator [Spongiibacter taiwanensis]USA43998.1 transcriptional regulator [Spongiibacter taiwanensis]